MKKPEQLKDKALFFSRKEYLKMKNQIDLTTVQQRPKSASKMEEAEMNFFEQEEQFNKRNDPAYNSL